MLCVGVRRDGWRMMGSEKWREKQRHIFAHLPLLEKMKMQTMICVDSGRLLVVGSRTLLSR